MFNPDAMRSQARLWRRVVVACALGFAALFLPTRSLAQTSSPPASKATGSSSATGETKEPAGKPISRPAGREALPPAPVGNAPVNSEIPPFHLARLALDGEVTGDRAVLIAEIDVDVNRADLDSDDAARKGHESHDVPLRLTQAHVLSKEYVGPGKAGPVVDQPVEDGLVWRFTGYGTHHLKLKMWVPIRQSPAGRQLVLSLPTMPPGFDAQLQLAIPGPPIVIRAGSDLSVLSNDRAGEGNRVSANVRGPRLDMTWSEPPEAQTSFLQATTAVTLRREGDRVIATAEQILIPENIGVKEAEIKLPDGFEIEDLKGPLVKGHEAILGRNGWRKVSFREMSGERIDLNWVLSAPFPANGGTLQFDGLVVPDARSQAGRIRLQDFPGYQMVPRPGQFVRRAAANTPQTAEAFEFTKQPFRIAWDVQRVTPKFSVRPRHLLFVSTTQLVLESRFRIQTDVGSLDQVELGWDAAMAEGWRLDPASVTGEVSVPPNGDQLNQSARLLLGWKTPQSGTFDLNLRFVRPLSAETQTSPVSLPQVRGARSQSSDLLVAAEDQLEVSVRGTDGAALPPASADPRHWEGVTPALASQIQRTITLDPFQQRVDLQWKPQTRMVEAEAELELHRTSDRRVRVRQTVQFHSRFGRLSAVRFQLPKSLAGLIPAGAAGSAIGLSIDGQSVVAQIRDGVIESPLKEPRLGSVVATLEYSLPLAANSTEPTLVPVLTALDAKFTSTRLRIPEGEPLRVPSTTEGWQPVPTSPDATIWVTATAAQVPILLDADQTASPRFSIDRAFYRTRLDTAGRVEGVCEFQWTGEVRGLPVTLPPESELLGAMCNGQALNPDQGQVVADAVNPSQLLFRIPPSREGYRLALLYRTVKATGFSHRDLRSVPLPRLSADVSVVRSIWELELPAGRHLFIGPGDLTPEYTWQRRGMFWSRVSSIRYLAEREAGTTEARQLTRLSEPGQVYAFSSIGPMEAPRFQSMTRSLILLLGAGLTLALGFLFWSVPLTRNMLTLLLLAFGVSILSLWFMEPIQLLLQPAVLGAVLAILASLIDLKSRRRSLVPFPRSSIPIPPQIAPDMGGPSIPSRGSSVSRNRHTPMPPTAVYEPGHSEVGSP